MNKKTVILFTLSIILIIIAAALIIFALRANQSFVTGATALIKTYSQIFSFLNLN